MVAVEAAGGVVMESVCPVPECVGQGGEPACPNAWGGAPGSGVRGRGHPRAGGVSAGRGVSAGAGQRARVPERVEQSVSPRAGCRCGHGSGRNTVAKACPGPLRFPGRPRDFGCDFRDVPLKR
ncbi:hypothetical protein GCM10010498_14920 [Streptomyces cavourensis]|nr:hypothetical protein GCM10010498_14920 [Streptomyces cavourensis]